MKAAKRIMMILLFITIVPAMLSAQLNFNGSKGLRYVHSAWTLDQGFLTLSGTSRGFGKAANFQNRTPYTVWSISGRANINYGMSDHVEFALTPIVYQDVNSFGSAFSAPSALFVTAKFGSFNKPGSALTYGLLTSTRIPLGGTHNIPLEPYTSNKVGVGVTGLLSYATDALYPEEAVNIHLNVGYWNHNDVDADLIPGSGDQGQAGAMSQELLYGVGVVVPKGRFDLAAEVNGNFFLQAPAPAAYSRENYLYLMPTFYYNARSWVRFNAGLDIRLWSSSDETLYLPEAGGVPRTFPDEQPNYPAWRMTFGAQFTLHRSDITRVDSRATLMQRAQSRRELFEQVVREQKSTESAEAELERIRAERIRAEQELERLRQILEGTAPKENKDDNDQL